MDPRSDVVRSSADSLTTAQSTAAVTQREKEKEEALDARDKKRKIAGDENLFFTVQD